MQSCSSFNDSGVTYAVSQMVVSDDRFEVDGDPGDRPAEWFSSRH
jgi:hypothetical protein